MTSDEALDEDLAQSLELREPVGAERCDEQRHGDPRRPVALVGQGPSAGPSRLEGVVLSWLGSIVEGPSLSLHELGERLRAQVVPERRGHSLGLESNERAQQVAACHERGPRSQAGSEAEPVDRDIEGVDLVLELSLLHHAATAQATCGDQHPARSRVGPLD